MLKKEKKKKSMEYETAPSGYVTLYNYKEPFMDFKLGFGYEGVLLFDGDTDKIQCHFCGKWFGQLPHHINRVHKIRVRDYKTIVGLRQSTALLSEGMRKKLIASGLDKRLQNLRAGGRKSKEVREKIRATIKKNVREAQNEKGTCPEQLLERLEKLYKEKGVPPKRNDIPFIKALINTYGSYENACNMANIPYITPSQRIKNIYKEKAQKGLIKLLKNFKKTHKRKPSYSDCKRGMLPLVSLYSFNGALKIAFKK